jgi:hypothetical protein
MDLGRFIYIITSTALFVEFARQFRQHGNAQLFVVVFHNALQIGSVDELALA